MSEIPKIPTEISTNGQEVWDWADRFSDHVHRLDRMRQLRVAIAEIDTVCGGCEKWMTRACPRETNVNGWNKGPSCKSLKCAEYEEKSWDAKRRTELQAELAELESAK